MVVINTAGIRHMRMASRFGCGVSGLALAWALLSADAASAQQAAPQASAGKNGSDIEEIVVTAQKREQSANTVPMSITAVSGEKLQILGIKDVSDLVKVTPGLTYSTLVSGSQAYSLRGIGFADNSTDAVQPVAVYIDEAPLPFADENKGALFDVERVEVLKGPQGTLFGENSTGGAINFIANKPTSEFTAGGDFTYGRFDEADIDGYVSGPITDTLNGRLAVEHLGMGDWQQSYTRNDGLGQQDFTNARAILSWEPTSKLHAQLTLSGWIDRSDVEAPQLLQIRPQIAPFLPLTGLAGYPTAPANDRAADWDPALNFARDNRFFQATARIDYDISSSLTLTSLSSYTNFVKHQPGQSDGTDLDISSWLDTATIDSYYQEVRLAGTSDRVNWIVGGDYSHETPNEYWVALFPDSTVAFALGAAPGGVNLSGAATIKDDVIDSYAAFGNLEYAITPKLTAQGGIRFTQTDDKFTGCTADDGDGSASIDLTGGAVPPGGCVTINAKTFLPGVIHNSLDENNVSWRAGLQYTPVDHTMLYANVSQGYKAGGFGMVTAFTSPSFDPAKQESVLAYEAGFKTTLLDERLQLNGAGFYYDYHNKQEIGTVIDPVFGSIGKTINVPHSQITGAELQVEANPFDGLTLDGAVTYIDSQVTDHFMGFNRTGAFVDFNGTPLPFTPQWQATANVRYEWPLTDKFDGFLGGNFSYQGSSYGDLGQVSYTKIKPYALTDLQAGVESQDGAWTAYFWGKNVFNVYHVQWEGGIDTISSFAIMPATYGVTLSYKFQ